MTMQKRSLCTSILILCCLWAVDCSSLQADTDGLGSVFPDSRDVDLADYNNLASYFDPIGNLGPHPWDHGNFDGDGDVDLADYNTLAGNFHPAGYGAAAVPEPSSIVLVIAGLLAAAGAGCWRH